MASPQKSQPEFTLQVRRTFAAPREKVFAAWAQREQLEKWMCADVSAHTVIHHQQDIRPGGAYLLEVRDSGKNEVYWGRGRYLEVKPPEKIVFTWSWTKGEPGGPNLHPDTGETRVSVEFFAHGDSTEVVLTHGVFGSQRDYDDHNQGWNGCFDVLESVLARTLDL